MKNRLLVFAAAVVLVIVTSLAVPSFGGVPQQPQKQFALLMKVLVTDGPFAETKEQLAGYYVLDCASIDEAIAWAGKIPTDCQGDEGCVEIRPIRTMKVAVD